MPREIFGEVANPTRRLGSQSRYTVPVSIAVHVVIAAGVVIVPLMATDVVPTPRTMIGAFMAAQPAPPPPPPPAAEPSPVRSSKPMPVSSDTAPSDAPSSIERAPAATTSSVVGVPGGVEGGIPRGVVGGTGVVPDVPAIPPPPAPAGPVEIGGRIKEPAKLRHVPPVYPTIAQQARIEGTVIIEAIIGVDGRVKDARVVESKAFLDEAAVTAVRQWLFTPTTLNGVPVPVKMTVRVTFKLH